MKDLFMHFANAATDELKINTDALPNASADAARISDIVGIVFGIMGSIAVLVIVFGGLKYIISRGEPQEMAQAKNTIIFALVGLTIVIMSYSIIAFVINNV